MSVQHNPPAAGPKPAAHASAPAPSKKTAPTDDGTQGAEGFLSLLLMQDAPVPTDPATLTLLQAGAPGQALPGATPTVMDAAADPATDTAADQAALLLPTSLDLLLGQKQARPLEAVAQGASDALARPASPLASVGGRRAGVATLSAATAALPSATKSIQDDFALALPTHGQVDDAPQGANLLNTLSSPALAPASKALQAERMDAAWAQLASGAAAPSSDGGLSAMAMGMNLGGRWASGSDRAGGLAPLGVAGGTESGWLAHSAPSAPEAPVPTAGAEQVAASDVDVAETVSFWVTQGIQNAELTIEGAGGDPVAVSISLKGGEAHIEFRTDQADVRQLLQGSLAHLKEMLSQEGVVLSGASFGSAASGGDGSRERRNPAGQRTSERTVTVQAPVSGFRAARPEAGRSLDVFV